MQYKIPLATLQCQRCYWEWHPRRENLPAVCPKCKSKKWQEAKVDKLVKTPPLKQLEKEELEYMVYLCPDCGKDSYQWPNEEMMEFHRDIKHRGIMHGHAKD